MADNQPPQSEAAKWKQRFENRQQKQRKMFDDAKKYFDIMYAVQSTTKISPWKSKVYLPILASKAWELIARMSDVVPLFNVAVKNELQADEETGEINFKPDVKARERRIENKLHYDYMNSESEPMKLKVFDPLVDAVVAGTGYAYAPWVQQTKVSKARSFDEAGNMNNTDIVEKTSEEGYNDFEGVNFFNVFPADAPSFFKAPYLIVRGYKSKVEMEKTGLYTNLDNVNTTPVGFDEFSLYNTSRNRVVNENETVYQDDTVEMVTYYQCFERTVDGIELTVYAEAESDDPANDAGWVVIRPKSIPYWHDMYPVIPFYLRKKSYSVFGESLFENNRTMQSATNDLFNHYLDNWNLSIESMIMYEDGTLTNDFIIEPGGEITYTGEKPSQFKFPEPNPQQLSVVMNVIEKGIDAATFSPYATGTPNDQNDKTQGTKYGVQKISEAATTKIGFFRDNFKQSMKTLGRIWLSNLQQFSDSPQEIRYPVRGKMVPDVVHPSDYQGEIDLDIDDDSMTPLSTQDKRDASTAFTNEIAIIQKMAETQAALFKSPSDVPRINFVEMVQDKAELYSVKDVEKYILDNNVQIPQDQSDPKEYLTINYKDLPADVKAQVEKDLGYTPSAIHDTELVTQAMENGMKQGMAQNGDPNGTRINGQPAPAGNTNPPKPAQ